MIFYLFIKVKRGEHVVSLNYRIVGWIFTKLGRDKVLMTPHICIDFWVKSAQGWIQGGANIGHGPLFSKELLLQTARLQQQTEYIAIN